MFNESFFQCKRKEEIVVSFIENYKAFILKRLRVYFYCDFIKLEQINYNFHAVHDLCCAAIFNTHLSFEVYQAAN